MQILLFQLIFDFVMMYLNLDFFKLKEIYLDQKMPFRGNSSFPVRPQLFSHFNTIVNGHFQFL